MIVQELHAIQHRCGYLPKDELVALSARINQPLRRLHAVASSFPHYRLEPPPRVDVRVCRDMACHMAGACGLHRRLEAIGNEIGGGHVSVEGVSCLGQCDNTPAISINDHVYWGKSESEIATLISDAVAGEKLPHLMASRASLGWNIDPYDGEPRYDLIQKFVKERNPDKILEQLESSGLVGMGGASFPTHLKWKFVRDAPGDLKYVVCNGDEAEPGTFKDREIIRRHPYVVIEGMVLAAFVVGATQGYIYIRHEFEEQIEVMREAIADAYDRGLLGENILGSELDFDLEVFVSPGGYICGEESALLEAMEDRAAQPRNKPPFPVTHGLHSKPTVLNNVETLAWVPAILTHGGEWYASKGSNGANGLRLFSVSGDCAKPGVYEVSSGLTVRELMDLVGGMARGKVFKALASSGPSGGFIPAIVKREHLTEKFVEEYMDGRDGDFDLLDLPLSAPALGALLPGGAIVPGHLGGMIGAALIIVGDDACMVDMALRCVEFYRNESCGKCVPCRMGSQKLVDIIADITHGRSKPEQVDLVPSLAATMTQASICGLGVVASNPYTTIMKYFPDELEDHIERGHCAAGICRSPVSGERQ